jgi:hypothetical protein
MPVHTFATLLHFKDDVGVFTRRETTTWHQWDVEAQSRSTSRMSKHDHVTLHNCPHLLGMQVGRQLADGERCARWGSAALKRAGCARQNSGPLGQQQAGFGGQRVGSRPSFSDVGCQCAAADVIAALRRYYRSAKLVLVRRSLGE